jgi:hypothetical protein
MNDGPLFRYHSGETVIEGDHITYAGCPGVVEAIFEPSTSEARDCSCWDTGGVMLLEREPATLWGRMLLTPPDGDCWGDLDFVCRQAGS